MDGMDGRRPDTLCVSIAQTPEKMANSPLSSSSTSEGLAWYHPIMIEASKDRGVEGVEGELALLNTTSSFQIYFVLCLFVPSPSACPLGTCFSVHVSFPRKQNPRSGICIRIKLRISGVSLSRSV